MDIIRGGPKLVRGKPKPKPKKEVSDSDLPTKIEVEHKGTVAQIVHGSVWRQKAFKWDPMAFVAESELLNEKIIEPSVQDNSLAQFLADPFQPMIYGIAGNPDDQKAKYFAAYLVAQHCNRLKTNANPWWASLTGGYENPWLDKDRARPTLIVLSNLTTQSTNFKLEKARDIIEAHPDVPRLIVSAGCDPLSFLTTKLHVPVHGLAYFSTSLMKTRMEVI